MLFRFPCIVLIAISTVSACRNADSTNDANGGEGGTSNMEGGNGGNAMSGGGNGPSTTTGGHGGGSGSAGSGSAGSGGSAGQAGTGRDSGIPDAAIADTAAPSDSLAIAAALSGQRWELKCGKSAENDQVCENNGPAGNCPAGGLYMLNKTTSFGGTTGTIYNVNIRVRGVVEPRTYTGGTADGKHFYVGGTPSGDNNYNVYSLAVASPKQIYYFNGDEGKGTGHRVFTVDHNQTIKIEGGSKLTMVAYDSNCSAIRNCVNPGPNCNPYIIDGVPPAPGAWNGQFVQLDVVSVTPHP